GTDLFGRNSELAVRPQTQAVALEQCKRAKAHFFGARGISALRPKIAILGPLQGGTAPFVGYTTTSLLSLGQRLRPLDMTGYAGAYHLLDESLQDEMRRAAMIGNYVELLSQLILESFCEKPFDILICMAQAPISGRALTELRKQGVVTVLWFVEDYLRFTYWR